jgi:hypothetical protein
MMSFGVPLGAKSPYHAGQETVGNPSSAKVGISGAAFRRVLFVAALGFEAAWPHAGVIGLGYVASELIRRPRPKAALHLVDPASRGRSSSFRHRYSVPPSKPEVMRCFKIADGLNTKTCRGKIGTSVPVLGLRPMRWSFLRTTKEPNEESFTASPRSRQSAISFSSSSTRAADSFRDNPTL